MKKTTSFLFVLLTLLFIFHFSAGSQDRGLEGGSALAALNLEINF